MDARFTCCRCQLVIHGRHFGLPSAYNWPGNSEQGPGGCVSLYLRYQEPRCRLCLRNFPNTNNDGTLKSRRCGGGRIPLSVPTVGKLGRGPLTTIRRAPATTSNSQPSTDVDRLQSTHYYYPTLATHSDCLHGSVDSILVLGIAIVIEQGIIIVHHHARYAILANY